MRDGDRKSLEPLFRRTPLPRGLASKDPEQALQQFVNVPPPGTAGRPTARRARLRQLTWRGGTTGKLPARFAWPRGWPGQGWQAGARAAAGPAWLPIEARADGKLKFASASLPPGTGCQQAVRLWKSRGPAEPGHQQRKEEVVLDPFGGRSWRGLRHPACLALPARSEGKPARSGGAKRGQRAVATPAGRAPRLAAAAAPFRHS